MANITHRLSTTWIDVLLHGFDLLVDRIERAARALLVDAHADFREAAHVTQIRRLAARGSSGQALT